MTKKNREGCVEQQRAVTIREKNYEFMYKQFSDMKIDNKFNKIILNFNLSLMFIKFKTIIIYKI